MARELPSPLVFFLISTHFTAPPEILFSSPSLYPDSFFGSSLVKLKDFTENLPSRLRISLRPIIPDNACDLRITAAAGT
jgi:hypothetical protein